ncbi:outer membrane protein assembly factor BamB family protein [Kitasatospora mediocidica]|uniref:outer membrane protein assembly factor BamB family protein n=1 Tax=Kitasatospora mediocidica TaxID=58352 RepID=UPI00056C7E5D|nr:PQQ-binding-like beta-propeller repeat protein [Kitasatospora mediocidica]
MAQDPPPAFGQGYPHGSDGQEPAGYEYQQSWYPQQPQAQPDPYGDAQHQHQHEQPWQWQDDQSQQPQQQPEPVYQAGYYAPYPGHAQPESADPTAGYQAAPGYDSVPSPPTGDDPAATVDPAEPFTEPADPSSSVPSPRRAGRSRGAAGAGDAEGAAGSMLDRAKAAAGALVASDRTPAKRALLIRTAAGVAALGVLVTAGFVATRPSAPAKNTAAAPTDTGFAVAHNKVWTAQPAAAAQPGADDTLVGSWLLADAVVRADSSGVHAYDLAAGKPTWSVAAPAAGAVPCGLSPTVNAAGLGGVLFRTAADPNSPCTLLAAVDSKTGKTAWTKTISGATGPYAAHVAVTDDKVIVVGDDKAVAWAAADGKDAWLYAGQGKFCSLSGNASGATVVVHSSCADSTPADQAVALSVAEGKVLWWRGLNNSPRTVTVLSAEPAVVLTTGDKPTDARVFGWGPTGDPAGEIPVATAGGRLDVAHGSFDPVPGVFFQGHTMTTTLLPDAPGAAVVTSYDLSTGKQLWQTPVSEKGTVSAVGIDNGALVLAADERVGQPAHLSRFALTGGQEDAGGGFPPDTGSLLGSGRVLTGDGKVIVVPTHSTTFGLATAYQAKS